MFSNILDFFAPRGSEGLQETMWWIVMNVKTHFKAGGCGTSPSVT